MAKKVKTTKATVEKVKALVASMSATRVLVTARRVLGDNPWYMAGTEGTGAYKVLAITARGRVGVRKLGDSVRIRVEPFYQCGKVGAVLTAKVGWKQPGDGGQNRFSKVVSNADCDWAIALAQKALGVDKLVTARPPTVQTESPVAVEPATDEDNDIPF